MGGRLARDQISHDSLVVGVDDQHMGLRGISHDGIPRWATACESEKRLECHGLKRAKTDKSGEADGHLN